MTNRDLLEKKLAFIERTSRELRTEARPDQIASHIRPRWSKALSGPASKVPPSGDIDRDE